MATCLPHGFGDVTEPPLTLRPARVKVEDVNRYLTGLLEGEISSSINVWYSLSLWVC